MLQNRVDPWGNIIKTSARGAWLGNRGVIHDEHKIILRSFRLKAWITCVLEFKGRKRQVMTPNRWTELFFLDEATAFSAGHRPCFECRREEAKRFKTAWIKGNPEYSFSEKTPIHEIDEVLHRERIDRSGGKVTFEAMFADLPMGTFVAHADKPWVVAGGRLYPWSPFGYGESVALPAGKRVRVLTPRSTMNAFRAGYVPQIAINV